jgi:NAD(P)-dependent dehydrogenase (short-subunit alcohol dehydrogenase family)
LILTASSESELPYILYSSTYSIALLVAGVKANAGPLHYSASKAAVVSMAQTAAYDLTGKNIRVNAICPGLIEVRLSEFQF